MPKLWSDTIETHRHEVRHAIMDTTWALATEHGPMSVTMSQVASEAGIGRATLYKYFPDVETILLTRHAEHVQHHLDRLNALCAQNDDPGERLVAVATTYAEMCFQRARHGPAELSAFTHRPEHIQEPERQLRGLFLRLINDASSTVRSDIPAKELVAYCLHALGAASTLPTDAAVHRLVALTLAALRPVTPIR